MKKKAVRETYNPTTDTRTYTCECGRGQVHHPDAPCQECRIEKRGDDEEREPLR